MSCVSKAGWCCALRIPAHTCTNPTLPRASHVLSCRFLGRLLGARARGPHRVVVVAAGPILALAVLRDGCLPLQQPALVAAPL